MKVLMISDLLSYGGASKLIRDLLPLYKAEGHQGDLLILTDRGSKYIDELRGLGISIHVLPVTARNHFARIRIVSDFILRGNYDVVHANLFPVTYYISVIKRMLGRRCPPIVMTEHSTDNRRRHKPVLRPLERFIYRGYDHVISISDATQTQLLKWLGRENDGRFSVIENGIDLDRFSRGVPCERNELLQGCGEGDVLIGMVGSFTQQKNHATMLRALALLPDRYKLLMAGEGPLMEAIRQQATSTGVADRTVFLGFRRDMPEFMKAVDVLVIPSLWEGFGLVAAEAMACATPVAVSDIPGLSEIVGECGVRFDPHKPESIRDAILKLDDGALVKRMVDAGAERAKNYDIRLMKDEYLKVYRKVCASGCR